MFLQLHFCIHPKKGPSLMMWQNLDLHCSQLGLLPCHLCLQGGHNGIHEICGVQVLIRCHLCYQNSCQQNPAVYQIFSHLLCNNLCKTQADAGHVTKQKRQQVREGMLAFVVPSTQMARSLVYLPACTAHQQPSKHTVSLPVPASTHRPFHSTHPSFKPAGINWQ